MNKNPDRHLTIDDDISKILNPMNQEERKRRKIQDEINELLGDRQ